MVVVDASVVIAAFCPDEASVRGSSLMLRAMEAGAMAPALFPYEIANVLLVKHRRRVLDASQRQEISALIAVAPIEIVHVPAAHTLGAVGDIANALAISAYDAAYLELARSHRAALATLDDRLAAAARHLSIEVL
jgi:predicted nucleic acid-binding protein